MNGPVRRDLRWNFAWNVLDVGIFFFGLGFAGPHTTVVVFAHEYSTSAGIESASPLLIGVVGALGPLGWYLPQLLTAAYVESLGRRKPFVLLLGLVERTPFLLMGVVAYVLGAHGGLVLLLLFVLSYGMQTFGGGFVATAWQELMASVIPAGMRSLFFGTAFLLAGLLMVAGGYLGGLVLEAYPRPVNYSLCFSICFALTMVSWCCLAQTREHATAAPRARTPLVAYLRRLPNLVRTDRNWRRYVLSQAAVAAGTMIGIFVPVWGKAALALGGYEVGLMTACAAAGQTVGNAVFGFLGDRRGHKLCLEIAAAAHVCAMATVLAFPVRGGLYVALVGIGIYIAGRNVSGTVIAFEFCEPADRPTYIGLTSTVLGPFLALGALLGGCFVMAFGYRAAFVLSLVLTAIGGTYLAAAVREPRTVVAQTSSWREGT